MEESIGTFSSCFKELSYVPPSQKNDSEKEKGDASSDHEIGYFEKHTKGIGMKLMEKMGYQQGKGIDNHGQGRLHPISVQKRLPYKGFGLEK